MEKMPVQQPLPACSNIPTTIHTNNTSVEEGPRLCPLCNSSIKLFFINFHEKMLMCENTSCEFPFGHEDLQFFTVKNPAIDEAELMNLPSRVSRRTLRPPSLATSQELNRIVKFNQEYSQSTFPIPSLKLSKEELVTRRKAKEPKEYLKKNIEKIMLLDRVLHQRVLRKGLIRL